MAEQPGKRLELSFVVDAPPERVFGMMTDPAELARWWGPKGFTIPEVELTLSEGGGYRLSMQPPEGDVFHISGEFLEIEPPSRLVYTFNYDEPTPDDHETTVTLLLRAVDGATEVAISQGVFATEERVELHRDGWTESFEKMRAVIDSQP